MSSESTLRATLAVAAGAVGVVLYLSKQQLDLVKTLTTQPQHESARAPTAAAPCSDVVYVRARSLERELMAVNERLMDTEAELIACQRELVVCQCELERVRESERNVASELRQSQSAAHHSERALRRELRQSQLAMSQLESKDAEIGEAAHFFKAIEAETMKIEKKIAAQQGEHRAALEAERAKSAQLGEELVHERRRADDLEERVLRLEGRGSISTPGEAAHGGTPVTNGAHPAAVQQPRVTGALQRTTLFAMGAA
ncbi:hypothetical protein KFE25_013596 [Diacronema lutheri]|uniref:Uncharacterized protein n=1 Tax=Diacronema lutheri TaxID=2081491 RepID=A0A8J5XIZ8_DIALT|nr:hypothetical protein KFE25_013596 [Diacronema lutheri]